MTRKQESSHDSIHPLRPGRAKSYYLRELIESGLDDLEDFYLADATMERVRKGQEAVIDSIEVRSSLDLGH
ncbi:MAG: CopG family transcriptional regulator [Betaproteobacteria bacterium]|nr:CopG family transcriptional regulator [Betaproteobacteria bacterium]